MNNDYTISNYFIDRLKETGVNHLFGVPGDYNLDFLDNVLQSPIQRVGNCNELNAGYAAEHPVILAGIEVYRYGLGKEALRLVESTEIPFSTMLSSKSVLPELHPQFIGIYQGSWSKEAIRKQVEESDCLLSLGAWMTDLDTGLFSFNLDPQRMISVGGGNVRIKGHYYPSIELGDFISELTPAIERKLHQDGLYNDIQMWKYARLPGFGHNDFAKGIHVTTEEELDTALKEAVSEKNKFFLIETCLPMLDCSAGLERLGNTFRQAKKK
ncbi:MAG: hypothetical protein K9H26_10525 [Prolixibacteraceae bacterium]|nr:hypothetical protein [Prolixibacteraceae bacterium]